MTPEQQQLVAENIKLAYWAAYKIAGSKITQYLRMDADDWIMIFYEVLCVTATVYNPDSGSFSTLFAKHARWAVGKEIQVSQYQHRRGRWEALSYDAAISQESTSENDMTFFLRQKEPDVLEALVDRTETERIARIANTLPEKQRDAFVGIFFKGISASDVGRAMGMTRQRASKLAKDASEKIQSRIEFEDRIFELRLR